MPVTRSARNSIEEADHSSPSNGIEPLLDMDSLNESLPMDDKCLECKEKYNVWFPKVGLDIAVQCPCILSLCPTCAVESKKKNEFCPTDKHLDTKDFFLKEICPQIEGQQTDNKDNPAGMDKRIPFKFSNKCMIYHSKPQSEDEFLKIYEGGITKAGMEYFVKYPGQQEDGFIRIPECSNDVNIYTMHVYSSHDFSPFDKSLKDNKLACHASSNKSSLNQILVVSVLILAIGIPAAQYAYLFKASSTGPIIDESAMIEHVFERVQSLQSKYSKQPQDLWGTLRRGMRNLVKESKEPMTILLLHSENTTVDTCFLREIKKIANDVAEYQIRVKEDEPNGAATSDTNEVVTRPKPKGVIIDMEINNDIFDNPGIFMEKYKAQLEQEKLMIVVNFHKSPLTVMEAFHFLTDAFDPYIRNILIILTVEVKNKHYDAEKNVEYIAEHQLADLLKGLPDHKSDPLITRLTENVYMINKEESMFSSTSCSLS